MLYRDMAEVVVAADGPESIPLVTARLYMTDTYTHR